MLFKDKFIKYFLAFLIFLISAVYITYPLIFNLGQFITGFGDQYLEAYVMNWVVHSLFTNPLGIFEGSIYYPYLNPIAYSETFITSSVLGIIPLVLFKEPIAIVNFTLLSSIFMVGFFTFVLAFYLTKNFWASLISGLLLIFSPVLLDKKTHIQILSIQWIPISILFFIYFTKTFKSRYLFLSLLFFLLQIYNSFLPAYFLIFFYSIYLFFLWLRDRKTIKKIFTRNNILIVLFSILLVIPIIKPYLDVNREYNAKRDIRDAIHFALQPEDLIYLNEHTIFQPLFMSISNTQKYTRTDEIKTGYIGLVFSVLSLFVIFYCIKRFRKGNILQKSFLTTGLLGLILSFGPALHFARQTIHSPFPVILPYALFYYIIPGFSGFRNSARWEILFIFCLAVLIALILPIILKNFRKAFLIYLVLILGIVAEYNFPMKFYKVLSISEFPKVYEWIDATPKNSVFIFMPIFNWNSPNSAIELEREYFYTKSFRKTVNGYSGFSPQQWQKDVLYLFNNFPRAESINKIKAMEVDFIVVNKDQYDSLYKNKYYLLGDGNYVLSNLNKNEGLVLKEKFGDTFVYGFVD
ncbi:MAG: hypothetical protein HYT06_01915 [Candidatus Levybacteria bacterium]|nr:hypothetical protein [Candidatus Levybacteria bacterium]